MKTKMAFRNREEDLVSQLLALASRAFVTRGFTQGGKILQTE